MSQRSYKHLKEQWPGRFSLTAEEVALVLNGKSDKAAADWIRKRMKRGDLKGAKRDEVSGGWRLPIPDLAEIIEPTPERPVLPNAPRQVATSKRRRAVQGPVFTFIRTGRFFVDVYQVLGWQDDIVAMKAMLAEEEQALREALSDRQRDALAGKTPEVERRGGRGGL